MVSRAAARTVGAGLLVVVTTRCPSIWVAEVEGDGAVAILSAPRAAHKLHDLGHFRRMCLASVRQSPALAQPIHISYASRQLSGTVVSIAGAAVLVSILPSIWVEETITATGVVLAAGCAVLSGLAVTADDAERHSPQVIGHRCLITSLVVHIEAPSILQVADSSQAGVSWPVIVFAAGFDFTAGSVAGFVAVSVAGSVTVSVAGSVAGAMVTGWVAVSVSVAGSVAGDVAGAVADCVAGVTAVSVASAVADCVAGAADVSVVASVTGPVADSTVTSAVSSGQHTAQTSVG